MARGVALVLQDLQHVRELLQPYRGRLVGVGMTAFSRIAPACFLDAYHVVAHSRTADLPILRKGASIFCLEEGGGALPEGRRDSGALLAHQLTRAYLDRFPKPIYLLLYQSYPELEDLGKREGWVLLGNPAALRLKLRERAFFQKMAADLGLCQVPGAIYPVAAALGRGYEAWTRDLGPEWVIQLADIAQGGGRGTFFIRSADDYATLRDRLKGLIWRETPLRSILIRKWIRGTPASVAICVTRHGVFVSGLQKQLIDLPYCPKTEENGIFCGHVWEGHPWEPVIQTAAMAQAEHIGRYVADLGYRGILGIDFVIDEAAKAAHPLEINPRLTGAFPMLSFLHMQNGIIPLDAFHLIEFLDLPCQIDVAELNRRYQRPLHGSHLLLFSPAQGQATGAYTMRAGIYEAGAGNRSIRFVGDGIEYADIRNDNQFIVVDGPPSVEVVDNPSRDPFSRLCHLLFPSPITDAAGALTPDARRVIDWIYTLNSGSFCG